MGRRAKLDANPTESASVIHSDVGLSEAVFHAHTEKRGFKTSGRAASSYAG